MAHWLATCACPLRLLRYRPLAFDATTLSTLPTSRTLAVRENVLTPGSQYTFQLTAGDSSGEAFATIVVRVASLPPSVVVEGAPRSSFVLLRVPDGARVREELRRRGWAVRRGNTFPGLTDDHLRVAVRRPEVSLPFAADLADVVGSAPNSEEVP